MNVQAMIAQAEMLEQRIRFWSDRLGPSSEEVQALQLELDNLNKLILDELVK